MSAADPDRLLLTRRRLVQAGGAAGAALYLGALTGTAGAAGVPAYLRRSGYDGLTGSSFTATGAGGWPASLRLTEVTDLVRAATDPDFAGRDDAFALSFSGPAGAPLESGIHELSHPVLGRFSVFIAPVERAAGEQRYEVVVDRSVRLAGAVEDTPEPVVPVAPATPQAPSAPASGTTTAAAQPAATGKVSARRTTVKPKPKPLIQHAGLARRGGVLACDVRVAPHRGVISVRATLLRRDGMPVARAARLVRGKVALRLNLRELLAVRPGEYDLRLTVTDVQGKRHVSVRRVTVR
jgi:hypothetical protein